MAYQILAKDGRPILKDGDPVRAMDYTVEKIEQLDDKMKSFVAVASTEDEDRDKDIVRQDGWDLKNFKKNPMIPWSHDYWEPPIARSLRTWVDKDAKKLMIKPQFDENDDKSMKIFNKYKNGFLTSFSVGFRGLEFTWRNEEDKWGGGIEFTKQELLEVSGVTIPANPNATVSLNGIENVQNMMQLGYPTVFAETESGLFYPVREELAEFVNPEVKTMDEFPGIQAVYANSITDITSGGNTGDPIAVGYYFDPETWNTGDIKGWISDHTDKTYKLHYYDWKWMEKDKDFEVEEKSAEKEVRRFEEPIKIQKSDDEDVDDVIDDEQTNDELTAIGDTIERIMTENMVKLTETLASAFDEIFDKILVKLDDIQKLVTEKDVDSDSKIDDNKEDDVETDDDPDKSHSEDDGGIEIDDSLLSPNDDKSNSDDTIEIDDDLLESKTVAETVNSVFREKLKETFKSVKAEKSIK
jgi:HK97 family phage prohead protease